MCILPLPYCYSCFNTASQIGQDRVRVRHRLRVGLRSTFVRPLVALSGKPMPLSVLRGRPVLVVVTYKGTANYSEFSREKCVFGLKTVRFQINTLSDTVDVVYLMPVGNILTESSYYAYCVIQSNPCQGSTSLCWQSWWCSVWKVRGRKKAEEEAKSTHKLLTAHLIISYFWFLIFFLQTTCFWSNTGQENEKM